MPLLVTIFVGLLATTGGQLIPASDSDAYWRVKKYDPTGFPCYDKATKPHTEMTRYYYKQPLYKTGQTDNMVQVKVDGRICFMASSVVGPVHSNPVLCPPSRVAQTLISIDRFLKDKLPDPKIGKSLGKLYPTFYHIAEEALYPGKDTVTIRANDEHRIARVSKAFHRALLRQGTAMLTDGRVLNVGKKTANGRRFIVLPDNSFGLGTSGYHLYPYRSAAVDFDYLCDAIPGLPGCHPGNLDQRDPKVSRKNRKALAGCLLYIHQLKGITMADSSVHDGFVCAVDVGGGIKLDRIDLFVGIDSAGNPYYPTCRRDNAFLRAGIASLIPSDWHQFAADKNGKLVRSKAAEYRDIAPGKGLDIVLFPEVRCRRRITRPASSS